MQCRLAATLIGLVEDIVDDQRYIVHHFENGGRANDRVGNPVIRDGSVAAEYRQRPEVFGLGNELPFEQRPHFTAGLPDPVVDDGPEALNLVDEAQFSDDVGGLRL